MAYMYEENNGRNGNSVYRLLATPQLGTLSRVIYVYHKAD